ncbi:MAG TPA: Asp-tRNA(Asn)/Glu-tRNA(Gln) amidotransferase subunit GatB [Candidatus Polarisedimenticolaceae bacterium]|nr:Asp-tRNA(Asn)/Glu-tRNA(Gln) amidotransferase subunit GatB [Candidatus Polarisedimenticolaceae bacterium]
MAQEETRSIRGMKYETIIGLEVHAQLLTHSKIFCGCSSRYGAAPNHHTCPVCAGFPGALPVLNKKVVEFALRAGLAMNCKIAGYSRLARKNYFYPDLPKGYQISQYELPICTNGYIDINVEGSTKRVRLTRIHIEEDAGKNIHDAYDDSSLIDLNRAGVPLLEIVSEPDIRNAGEAVTYLKSLRTILRYLEVCDGNMEEGSFRCDANISVRTIGTEVLGTKVEIKNLNSFKAIEKALQYETERQMDTLSEGGTLVQETRLWDDDNEQTRSMRSKESAHDYRYFPDPDLLPINVDEEWTQRLRSSLSELPDARKVRFISQYGLPAYDAELLTSRKDVGDYFEAAIGICPNAKALSNWIMGDLFRVLKERKLDEQLRIDKWPLQPTQLGELLQLIDEGKISGKIAKMIFDDLLDTDQAPHRIITERGLEQVSDPASLERSIDQVLTNHPNQVAAYHGGNEKIFSFFVGQVMKALQGKANPQKVNEILRAKLS